MVLKDKKGIGLTFALQGLKTIFQRERNFRIQLLIFSIVIVMGVIFRLSYIEWAIIIFVSSLVLSLEILNSVVELMIDYIKPENHPTAKKIKDMAASSVLISSISAVIIGIILFLRKTFLLL